MNFAISNAKENKIRDTGYSVDGRFRFPEGATEICLYSQHPKTGSVAHPAFYAMGTWGFSLWSK
jgi:hypothetical protein